ncbi:MAG TPA: gluconate 2-dehydrogenase subunit 3 family protein [Pyrinomonadaceae bacterium]|jgi:hypothetical protein|nr:gluconate 2-dehydrogenase subunit 3 family protein [Pyrinomonadaceae bacterium]
MKERKTNVSRREVLKGATGAAVALPLFKVEIFGSQYAPKFFTPAEFALVDELTEMIIPTDDHSPGARAAKVAAYLDFRVAETDPSIPEYAELRRTWREGLKAVDRLSREMNKADFLRAAPAARLAVLTRMAKSETAPQKKPVEDQYRESNQDKKPQTEVKPPEPNQDFFAFLKAQTVRAYYTSEIGLMRELEYKGNQYLKEFVGYDASEPV